MSQCQAGANKLTGTRTVVVDGGSNEGRNKRSQDLDGEGVALFSLHVTSEFNI
jgi:hypothetical protein